MPKEAKIIRGQVFAGIPIAILARVDNLTNGEPLLVADVSQVSYDVFDTEGTAPTVAIGSGNLTVAEVIHALKRDSRWGEDSIGYNFSYIAPATIFPQPGKTYAVRFLFFTGSSSPSAVLVYNIYVLATTG